MSLTHPPPDPSSSSNELDARSERRFRLLAESIPQIVWSTRADGYCDYQNCRWYDYSGLTLEESAGVGWIAAVHPDDRALCNPVWPKVPANRDRFEFEYRLRRKDGVYRWFLVRAEPILDDEDRVVRWFGTSTDIDDRKRAEDERFRESEERLRLAASAARLGYWDCDLVNDRITWSQSLTEISGTSPAAFSNNLAGFLTQLHPDDRERVQQAIMQAIDKGSPYDIEFRFIKPDGSIRWALAKGQVYYDLAGKPVRMAGIDVDITRQKETEEELRRKKRRFRASIDTLIDCFGIYAAIRDESGQIRDFRVDFVNEAACRWNGFSSEQQVGRGLLELYPSVGEVEIFKHYCQVVETGESVDIEEFTYVDQIDGQPRTRLISVRLSKLEDGFVAAWRDITDRKRDAVRIAEGDEFERLIREVAPAIVYIYDLETGDNLHLRGKTQALLGYTEAEIEAMGSNFIELVMHPDDQSRFIAHLAKLNRSPNDVDVSFEYRMLDSQGRYHWFISRDKVYERNADGSVKQIMGVALEITDRIETEELFKLEGEKADLAICEIDYLNNTIYLPPEALRMFGLPETNPIVPRSLIHGLFHDDDRPEIEVRIARSHDPDGDGLFAMEHRIVRPDGMVRWHSVRKKVFFGQDHDGRKRSVRSLLAIRDVTDKKDAQAILLESEERFRKFCNSDIIGIIFGRADGEVSYANDEYLRILGYTREEFEAGLVNWVAVTPPEWLPVDELAIANARQSGGSAAPYEKEYIRQDGTRIPVLVGFTLYGADQDQSIAFILDMTEVKKAESALQEADRRKDEFLAMLSHELRNPLSTINNALMILRTPGLDDEGKLWAEEVADRQLNNLVRIIEDLLDVSRIRSGKVQLLQEPLDLATVVPRAIETLRPFIDSRGHQLEVAIAPRPMPIVGDPTRLEQVVGNLLNNAAKYTHSGGRIWVDVRPEGNEAVVRVRDNGMGIGAEMLPIIFDLFAQVDATIDRSHGGLGIGLSLVRNLIEMHGGRVSATSTGIGQGSEFTIRLPLAKPVKVLSDDNTRANPGQPSTVRILLVDDDDDSLRGLARLLKVVGHEVMLASDGPSAVASALEHRPEVILLDLGLPGMSGFTVAETLRSKGLAESMMIAVSGHNQTRDRERSREAGFDHHLGKPVDFDALLGLIARRDSKPD